MNRIKSMVINISLRHRSRMRKSLSRKLYSPPLHVVEYRKSYYHISTSLRGIFPRYQDVNRDVLIYNDIYLKLVLFTV